MRRPRILLTATLLLGAWCPFGVPLEAGDPIAELDIVLEQDPGGLIALMKPGVRADEIVLALPEDWIEALRAVEVPAGWTLAHGTGKKWVFVRLRSCTSPAEMQDIEREPSGGLQRQQEQIPTGSFLPAQGPSVSAGLKPLMQRQVRALVQYGSCAAEQLERASSRRMKLAFGKSLDGASKGIAVESYRLGTLISATVSFEPPLLEPAAAAGSLRGLLELPPTMSPGETVRGRVLDSGRLPAGGRWSLSGVELDEAPSADVPPKRGTITISPADPSTRRVKNVRRMLIARGGGESRSESAVTGGPGASPSVTFDVFQLETPLVLRDRGLALYAVAAAQGRCRRPAAPQETWLAEATSGFPSVTTTVLSCSEAEPPSLPDGVEIFAIGAVGSEPTDAFDDDIAYLLAARAHEGGAAWTLVAYERSWPADVLWARRTDHRLELTIPSWLATDRPPSLSYEDRWGRQLLSVAELESVEVTEPLTDFQEPSITGGSRFSFPGGTACVCGAFPTEASRAGILLGAVAADTTAASSRTLTVAIPQDSAAGEVVLSGDPEAGFTESDRHGVTIVSVEGRLDREQLKRGGSITTRMHVVGTAEPMPLMLTNRSPEIVRLEGGNEQILMSSGGRENIVEFNVQVLTGGAFDIAWALDLPCSCASED